jgi:TPR repeat protein
MGSNFPCVTRLAAWSPLHLFKAGRSQRIFGRAAKILVLVAILDAVAGTKIWGSSESDYSSGYAAMKRQDYAEAAAKFKSGAEHGYAPSQCALASLYYQGAGVAKDYSRAFDWAMKAAQQDHPRCEWFVGLMYGRGEGVGVDSRTGMRWLCKSARRGFDYAKVTIDMIIDSAGEFPAPMEVELAAQGEEAGLKSMGLSLDDLPWRAGCKGQE